MGSNPKPYEGQKPYLFLLYAPEDAEQLAPLAEYLDRNQLRLWYDAGNLNTGIWQDTVENHLEDCKAVIAFVTEAFSLSHICRSGIVNALKCRKKVIPVLLGTPALPRGLRMQLGVLRCLSLSDFEDSDELMAKVIKVPECQACRTDIEEEPDEIIPVIPVDPVDDPVDPDPNNQESGGKLQHLLQGLIPKNKGGSSGSKPEFRLPELHLPKLPLAQLLKKQPEPEAMEEAAKEENPQEPPQNDSSQSASEQQKAREPEQKEEPPAQQASGSNQLYISKESSAPSDPRGNAAPSGQLYVSKESSASADLSQAAQQRTVAETPTVLDPHRTDLRQLKQAGDNQNTVLIYNRTLALLLHVRGKRAYTIRKPQTRLGRSPIKCDVVLEGNDSISKLHAELLCYNGKFYLTDAGSKNGTYLPDQQVRPGDQVQLATPACFHLNNEPMILIAGDQARALSTAGCAALLTNADGSAALLLDQEVVRLNRNSKWYDGTLNDPKVHRAAHAQVRRYNNDYYLVDESPENGNDTMLNQYTLRHGEARRLADGDRIQLGDTVLQFVTIHV